MAPKKSKKTVINIVFSEEVDPVTNLLHQQHQPQTEHPVQLEPQTSNQSDVDINLNAANQQLTKQVVQPIPQLSLPPPPITLIPQVQIPQNPTIVDQKRQQIEISFKNPPTKKRTSQSRPETKTGKKKKSAQTVMASFQSLDSNLVEIGEKRADERRLEKVEQAQKGKEQGKEEERRQEGERRQELEIGNEGVIQTGSKNVEKKVIQEKEIEKVIELIPEVQQKLLEEQVIVVDIPRKPKKEKVKSESKKETKPQPVINEPSTPSLNILNPQIRSQREERLEPKVEIPSTVNTNCKAFDILMSKIELRLDDEQERIRLRESTSMMRQDIQAHLIERPSKRVAETINDSRYVKHIQENIQLKRILSFHS